MEKFFDKIYRKNATDFHDLVEENLISNNKMFIVTANPETFMMSEKNEELKKALLDNDTTIIADGIGIIKGAKYLGNPIPQTIPGVELCAKLFEFCNKNKKKLFLFGAKPEILDMLVKKINLEYPNIDICGYENGYVEDKNSVFDKMVNLEPDVVLVALGIPNQEILIYKNINRFNKGIFVGVGGSFDVLSGAKRRAPKVFRKLHLEWFYRIIREPKRIKRFLSSNVKYLLQIRKMKK